MKLTKKEMNSFTTYAKRLTVLEVARCHDVANRTNLFYNYTIARQQLTEYLEMLESAYFLNSVRLFTNKERNALKRDTNNQAVMSTFCKSMKTASQAFRIDEALKDYHSMKELTSLAILDDCREARIKSHISFLQNEFKHSCKMIIEDDTLRIKRFKFVTI